MNSKVKKIVTLAMLSAFAYVVMAVGRIPIVMFLEFDPKDVIIAIGGFIFGPLSAFIVSAVVALVEMVTVSETGIIGFVMNLISSCAFACTAALVYKKDRTGKGAIIGLLLGTVLMTAVMLLWNYLISPFYMNCTREEVVALLTPVFLPFNIIKGGLNTAITLLAYKPIVKALRKGRLIEKESQSEVVAQKNKVGMLLVALLLLVTFVLSALVLSGVL